MHPNAVVETRRLFHVFNCATHGDVQILRNFLKHEQLDVNQRDANGKTTLYLATEYNQEVAVTTLIQAGAYMEAVPFGECPSRTPVMIAAEFGYTDCLRALTAAGADINVSSPTGETPLKVALKKGNCQCGKILLIAGAKINKCAMAYINASLFAAVPYEDPELLEILLKAGANPNQRDEGGRTALMYAVGTESAECCHLLLTYKADVNARDFLGNTALMYPSNKQTMEVLLNNGSDPEVKNNRGRTPLVHFLLNQSNNIHKAMNDVNILLEHGTNPVVESYHRLVFCCYSQSRNHPEYPHHNFTLESTITFGKRQLIRLNVCNGVVPERFPNSIYDVSYYMSPIGCALHFKHDDVVKYFLANCYLTYMDITDIHQILRREAVFGFNPRVFDEPSMSKEMETLLHKAVCEPWPLVKLAFIAVSSALGTSPEREQRIARTCLPDRLKRMLMFQEPIARLPVSEWSNIPLYFDPMEYEAQPRPRPLLYYWPFGRTLVV